MTSKVSLGFIAALAIVFPDNVFAYRPFATEDAGVAGKGVAQIETSWDYLQWDNGDEENVLLVVPIYGATERTELSLEIPYMFHAPRGGKGHDGAGDINIVGKVNIVPEGKTYPAFTGKGMVKAPTGDAAKNLGTGDTDYGLFAAATKSVGDITCHAMAGYTFVGSNGDKNIRDIYVYGIGADYGLTEAFHIIAEMAGSRHPDRRSRYDPLAVLVGAAFTLSGKMTMDGAFRQGLTPAMPKWSTTMGVSLTF